VRWDDVLPCYMFLYHDDGRQLGRVYEDMVTGKQDQKAWYWNDFTSDQPYLVSRPCATQQEATTMLIYSLVTTKLEDA